MDPADAISPWLGARGQALAHCWTWHCPVDHLLLVTDLSLRGLKDTGAFGLCCAWLFLLRCWKRLTSLRVEAWAGTSNPLAWAQRSLHLPYVTSHSSRGARRLLPAPGKRKGPCSIGSLNLQALALRRKLPLLARGTPSRLLGTISRTSFGAKTYKESRIRPFNADAFLFTQ